MSVSQRFEYQAPAENQVDLIRDIRNMMRLIADRLEQIPMDDRCRALAVTKLEEANMWANKGVVFYRAEIQTFKSLVFQSDGEGEISEETP